MPGPTPPQPQPQVHYTAAPHPPPAGVPAVPVSPARPYPQSPSLEMGAAVAVLVVNLVLPGIGTIIAGVIGKQRLIGRGLAQFFLTFLLLAGWIWALVTSIQVLTNARKG